MKVYGVMEQSMVKVSIKINKQIKFIWVNLVKEWKMAKVDLYVLMVVYIKDK
jgi:hypothetical protein